MAVRLSAGDQRFGMVDAVALGTTVLASITNKPRVSSRW
jgi:hypothetical protein